MEQSDTEASKDSLRPNSGRLSAKHSTASMSGAGRPIIQTRECAPGPIGTQKSLTPIKKSNPAEIDSDASQDRDPFAVLFL
jgi:hypothetical protein